MQYCEDSKRHTESYSTPNYLPTQRSAMADT
jgi:hypothetical protein